MSDDYYKKIKQERKEALLRFNPDQEASYSEALKNTRDYYREREVDIMRTTRMLQDELHGKLLSYQSRIFKLAVGAFFAGWLIGSVITYFSR